MEILAKGLIKLERLILNWLEFDNILPFVHYSKRLKVIRIRAEFVSDIDNTLDLFALNEERKKLANACQVSIGVCENAYLLSKWKANVTQFSHVKITRFSFKPDLFLVPM